MNRFLMNFQLALEGVNANRLRAVLTALGIMFGVGAVIAMLAIGTGAKQAILDQLKLIGTNNIVIKSIVPEAKGEEAPSENTTKQGQGNSRTKTYSPGLTIDDVENIEAILPTIERISPEIILPTNVVYNGRMNKAKCVGVYNDFFDINHLSLSKGTWFNPKHRRQGSSVCIIGKNIQTRFFSQENPIGKQIKCGQTWLTVIGVLEKRFTSETSLAELGIRDYNDDVYVPVQTMLLRFKNRALVKVVKRTRRSNNKKTLPPPDPNYHQIDRLVIRVEKTVQLEPTANVIARLLKRRHRGVEDVEIQIPKLLLEQQQQTQDTFNIVLGAIAGISLLVGGIGIMNIMLASVMERIKEIGVRRSLGATYMDIVWQFLLEAVVISLIGGLIGVIMGVLAASSIAKLAEIPTIVSMWSILLSFGVAASIGLVFGFLPAQRAAKLDPVKALRQL